MPINYLPRSGTQAPSPWHAVGQGARGLGQMIMDIASRREEEERLADETSYRRGLDLQDQKYRDRQMARAEDQDAYQRSQDLLATKQYDADEREETGRYYQERADSGFGQMLSEEAMKSSPGMSQYQPGPWDPSRDVGHQRALALRDVDQRNDMALANVRAAPTAPTINLNGREFPDTPEGEQAALEWRAQVEGETGGGLLGRYADELGELGEQAPERPRVPGFMGGLQRFLPGGRSGYLDEPASPSLLGKQGLSAEQPAPMAPDTAPSRRLQGPATSEVPDWFRAQHADLVRQGAPSDIEEAWRQYNGGQ